MITLIQENLHLQWIEQLRKTTDKYSEQIYKKIDIFTKTYEDLFNKELSLEDKKIRLHQLLNQLEDDILEIIYRCLEDIYSLTLKYIKNMYGIKVKKPIDLSDLTYHRDGLTLEERLHNHIQEWYEKLSQEDLVSRKELKEVMSYQMILIVDTETFAVSNNLVYQKVAIFAITAEIIAGDACEDCRDIEAEGEVPVSELIIPPFHPNCECSVIYHLGEKVNIEI